MSDRHRRVTQVGPLSHRTFDGALTHSKCTHPPGCEADAHGRPFCIAHCPQVRKLPHLWLCRKCKTTTQQCKCPLIGRTPDHYFDTPTPPNTYEPEAYSQNTPGR